MRHDEDICIVLDKIVMLNVHNLEGLCDPIASLSLEKVGATIASTGELGLVSIVGPAVTLVKGSHPLRKVQFFLTLFKNYVGNCRVFWRSFNNMKFA